MDITTLSVAQSFTKGYVQEQIKKLPQSGANDYTKLENKPKINGVELDGDKTLEALGIPTGGGSEEWELIQDITLEEDISQYLLELNNVSEFTILYEGRLNDSDDSLTTGNGTAYIRLNNNNMNILKGSFSYKRAMGTTFKSAIHIKSIGDNIASGVMYPQANTPLNAAHVAFDTYPETTGKITLFKLVLTENMLFKAGGKFKVYVRG